MSHSEQSVYPLFEIPFGAHSTKIAILFRYVDLKPWFFSSSSAVPQELVVQLTTTAQANFEPAGSEHCSDFPCFPRKMIYKLQVFHIISCWRIDHKFINLEGFQLSAVVPKANFG